MKKMIALALSLVMILCAAFAVAEGAATTEKTEIGTLNVGRVFTIQGKVPEGYTYMPITKTELNLIGMLSAGEDKPTVTISIAYNEAFDGMERFNDADEKLVEEIRESFREADDNVQFEDLETDNGTRLLKATNDLFVDIYTIYKGYELEFVMTGAKITDADVQMLVDYISDIDFVPAD